MIHHLTSYWCIPALWNIIISVSVNFCVTDVYLCISAIYYVFFAIYCIFLLYFQKKKVNISMVHHFYVNDALKRRAPQTLSLAHVEQCATVITSIIGAHRCVLRIKVICGFIYVAHARCATKPKNGAPQIGVLLVVNVCIRHGLVLRLRIFLGLT
jgi:hypothetical protein